jgi:phosphotransferase system enzyme I (PtsI)
MILADALKIPSLYDIASLPGNISYPVKAIIDSHEGVLILSPSETTLKKYEKKLNEPMNHFTVSLENRKLKKSLEKIKVPVQTPDGSKINLFVNLELPEELGVFPQNQNSQAQTQAQKQNFGVGLCRSEFLFQNIFQSDVAKQTRMYSSILRHFGKSPVYIRLFDIGSEKTPQMPENPDALFSIRYLLRHQDLLEAQLESLLLASNSGNLKILIPMVTLVEEVEEIIALSRKIADRLEVKLPEFAVMIETPAAIDLIPQFNHSVQSYSVGTNDLLQFTTVTDRNLIAHRYIYSPLHESLLASLERIIQLSTLPITVCGEMAGDIKSLNLLIGLGYRSFSMGASKLADIHKSLAKLDIKASESLLANIRSLKTIAERRKYLHEYFL